MQNKIYILRKKLEKLELHKEASQVKKLEEEINSDLPKAMVSVPQIWLDFQKGIVGLVEKIDAMEKPKKSKKPKKNTKKE
jgi:hypothetical protein